MARYYNSYSGGYRDFEGETPGYPWVAEDQLAPAAEGNNEVAAKTADAILAEVGDDASAALAALTAENAREAPRTTLTAKLQKIIDAAE